MWFENTIRSKLASLLQPWLQEGEPAMELQLGFLTSHGSARNLIFNTSALNRLIEKSIALSFKDVRVEDVSVRIYPWSVPALTLEVRGINVTLALRESEAEVSLNLKDLSAKELKEKLASIDPEGTSLHAIIESSLAITRSRNRLTTAINNVLLNRFRIQVHDIHVQLKLPVADNSFAYFLKVKELSVGAASSDYSCLLKALVAAFFVSQEESSVDLNCTSLEIGSKREDSIIGIASSREILTCYRVKNQQHIDIDIHTPQVKFALSPADLPVLVLTFEILSSKKVKGVRNGRELWKIAIQRIPYLIKNPRFSLHKLANIVVLWLRYVRSYESLLRLVGYSAEKIFKRNMVRMSRDRMFSSRIKHRWNVISEIETELPVEAIARARRIARYRAALNFQHDNAESSSTGRTAFLWNIPALFSFPWKIICSLFRSVLHFFFLVSTFLDQHAEDRASAIPSDDLHFPRHFSVNLEEISLTLSPVTPAQSSIKGKSVSDIRLSDLNLLSFCLSIKAFCLTYATGSTAQSFTLGCGDFKIDSSRLGVPLVETDLNSGTNQSFKSLRLEADNNSITILCSEPAPQFNLSKKVITDSPNLFGSAWVVLKENFLVELWSDWKKNSHRFERKNTQNLEDPFILCQVKNFVIDPSLSGLDYGLWKCGLSMGKLNLDLDYSSILSISLLLGEIQDAIRWTWGSRRLELSSHFSSITEGQAEIKCQNLWELYISQLKLAMLSIMPEKNVQVGMAIAGLNIRLSMRGVGSPISKEQDSHHIIAESDGVYCFVIDLEEIEIAVWPTSKAALAALTGDGILHEAAPEYCWLKGPRLLDIPKADLDKDYISNGRIALDACLRFNGLNASVECLEEQLQSQVIWLTSITLQSSSCREYLHSFMTSANALSMNLSGMATEGTLSSYVDELWTFFQMLGCTISAVSCAYVCRESIGVHFQEVIRKDLQATEKYTKGNVPASEAKLTTLIFESIQFIIDVNLEFKSQDVILRNFKRIPTTGYGKKADGASSSATCYNNVETSYKKTWLCMLDVPDFGIGVSVRESSIQISWGEGSMKVLCNLSKIQSVIFTDPDQTGKCIGESGIRNLFYQSVNYSYDFSISNCTFSIYGGPHENGLSPGGGSNADDASSSASWKPSNAVESLQLTTFDGGSKVQSGGSNQKTSFSQLHTARILVPSSYWFLINIELGEICMADSCMKEVMAGAHQPNKLQSSISIDEEFRTISCEIQGGLVFLETTALATFIHCFRAYLLCIANISSIGWGVHETVDTPMVLDEGMSGPGNYHSELYAQGTVSSVSTSETSNASPDIKWKSLEVLTIRLSQFALVLATADGSGGARELMLETDFYIKLESFNSRKLFFNLSRLTILSQRPQRKCAENSKGISGPRISSCMPHDMPSRIGSGHPITESVMLKDDDGASSTNTPVSQKEFSAENGVSEFPLLNHKSYILKHLDALIVVEKAVPGGEVGSLLWRSNWVGSGSISDLDLTITLSEIQMLLDLVSPLSGVSGGKTSHIGKQKFGSKTQGHENSSENTIPDGAIVAIQDLNEHMYFAVDAVESKYRVVGAIHYSLVGAGALFRVRYHKQRRWSSPVSWFSLMSLYAKSDAGEPLRLNFCPGSGFVEISSDDDRCWALWRTYPYQPESYEGDNDLEFNDLSVRKAFYLVNQKSDCAVAFVDGLPEFVEKPGNLFKMKVFHDFCLTPEVARQDVSNNSSCGPCKKNVQDLLSCVGKEGTSGQVNSIPHVEITIDKVILTILHEVSKAKNTFPLLRGCIDNAQFVVQILSSKTRLISKWTAAIHYLDAQGNDWREILSPVNLCMFYRHRFGLQSSETAQQIPLHFIFKMSRVEISLNELSLDVLLFLVGELNLAGPFAVRNSMIFSNLCKVENHSGLRLLCHLEGNQDAIIAGKQSALIFLRHAAMADRVPENAGLVSIQLSQHGVFSTSPFHINLLDARVIAWRTRVVSLQDSKTFPGPFVVVDISRTTEDGLSLVVSPLLRVHNESGFPMELRFRRPQQIESESASFLLKNGDTMDDSVAAFNALKLSGGIKKALLSLGLGNFLLSFRPENTEYFEKFGKPVSIDWSDDLKGEKAVRLSGIFDKLRYRFKKAFGVESVKSSFSTVNCSLRINGQHLTNLHFLIQTIGRDVPVIRPPNLGEISESNTSPVALQEQKEIFLFPTVQVLNLLQLEIFVLLTETHPDLHTSEGCNHAGKQAIIPCGSSALLYANPAVIYFTVTLNAFKSKCKPVNSGEWIMKLQKQKSDIHHLDIDLDFGGGRYFASLRLTRGDRGILEATVFTTYTLQNDTDLSLLCFPTYKKPLSRADADKYGSNVPPEFGSFLPPKSTRSWFLKSNRVHLKLLEEKAYVSLLDFDILSGFTEVCLEVGDEAGVKHLSKMGVSLKPCFREVVVPAQTISIVPRYVISNESEDSIIVRQCYLQGDMDGIIAIDSKQKTVLLMCKGTSKRREISFLDSMLRKHRNSNEDSLTYIQFCLKEVGWSWSGPICIASLGRFFLKFKRLPVSPGYQSNSITENNLKQFAVVHIVEEGSSLVLHFCMPPNCSLPYRIENCLNDAAITYYQKDSIEPEILRSGNSVEYVWDDINMPHKLVVQVSDMQLLREINMDKVHAWKPFFKVRQSRGLVLHFPWDKKSGYQRTHFDESYGREMRKVGYEVYADGPTRVLRISEFDSFKEERVIQPCAKIQFRVSWFAIHLLDKGTQDVDESGPSVHSTIIVARFDNITLDSMYTDQHKIYQIRVQSLSVDEKWLGAPFVAMLRRNRLDDFDTNQNLLQIVFILHSTNSKVKQVKYASILLQPIDLNLDEETLMRLVPFWRTSLSDSNTQSQQFYFKHFEIHPIKIVARFLPGNPNASYSSAQETLRSLLHTVIKIPTVKNMVVELNGVLLTHALVTARELVIKCAQHYSWYAVRAVYIAKGSQLLPPAFASIFDDSASSSLDVFFDPASGLINLPGLTFGMFNFISKCVKTKGFSGTKRYFGDLGKTMRKAGSNVLFAAITEISDSVLKGAETSGFNGMVNGIHQGILKLAMEPSLLGTAVMEGGPNRKIKLDHSPGVDELYIEGYLQAMLDVIYKQEYLRVRVIDDLVLLKNLPPNSSLINEIVEQVKSFLIAKALLKGDPSITTYHPLRHLHGENEWKIGPTLLTLCEHLFVNFVIRMLRNQAGKIVTGIKSKDKSGGQEEEEGKAIVLAPSKDEGEKFNRKWAVGKFVLSGVLAYIDGRLCRCIPNKIARRIVSGFLLSFLDKSGNR